MKKIFSTLLVIIGCIQLNWAQQKSGHLTIISEDNTPFFLYLNDVQYNQTPLTAIRIEDLNAPTYHCKLVFANKHTPSVENRYLSIADFDGYMQDITYTVSNNRRGDRAFMVYHIIPLEPIDVDTRNIQVYNANRRSNFNNWKNYDNRYQFSNNNYRKPHRNFNTNNNQPNDHYNQLPPCIVMEQREFDDVLRTIKNTSLDSDKLNVARTVLGANCFTVNQIEQIIKLFSFDESRLTLAKDAYASCINQNQYFKISNLMLFSSSKNELNNFIQRQQRR